MTQAACGASTARAACEDSTGRLRRLGGAGPCGAERLRALQRLCALRHLRAQRLLFPGCAVHVGQHTVDRSASGARGATARTRSAFGKSPFRRMAAVAQSARPNAPHGQSGQNRQYSQHEYRARGKHQCGHAILLLSHALPTWSASLGSPPLLHTQTASSSSSS